MILKRENKLTERVMEKNRLNVAIPATINELPINDINNFVYLINRRYLDKCIRIN